MIAVDTDILIYAHREDVPEHERAAEALAGLASRGLAWGVPWPCVHEFFAVVTHPRVFAPPTPAPDALAAIDALGSAPGIRLLGETPDHLAILRRLVTASG